MNPPRIGIASHADMKARTMAVARGELKLGPDEPKLWFTSIESMAKSLNDVIAELPLDQQREVESETARLIEEEMTRQARNRRS